jgi:AbrB family looped-hinge helix DNA binding protein
VPIIKVNAKYQITVPLVARKKLNIKKGDNLLVDVQDDIIVLLPEPKRYTDYLQGLHSDIWKSIDTQKYLKGKREAWENSAEG